MIKVFTANKDGKIELTTKELKEILDEAYWEGYKAANNLLWTCKAPNWFKATDIQGGTIAANDCVIKSTADNHDYEG